MLFHLAIRDSNAAGLRDKAETASNTPETTAADNAQRTSIFSALAAPQYRRFWFGSLASVGATQLLIIGQGVLVFDISGSEFLLGLAGAVTGIATIVVTLFGGGLTGRDCVVANDDLAARLMWPGALLRRYAYALD